MTKKEIQKQENMLVENAWKIAKSVWFSQSIEIDETACIVLDLGGIYARYISPHDNYVDVASNGSHDSLGNIDLDNMSVLDVSNRHRYDRPIKKWEDA